MQSVCKQGSCSHENAMRYERRKRQTNAEQSRDDDDEDATYAIWTWCAYKIIKSFEAHLLVSNLMTAQCALLLTTAAAAAAEPDTKKRVTLRLTEILNHLPSTASRLNAEREILQTETGFLRHRVHSESHQRRPTRPNHRIQFLFFFRHATLHSNSVLNPGKNDKKRFCQHEWNMWYENYMVPQVLVPQHKKIYRKVAYAETRQRANKKKMREENHVRNACEQLKNSTSSAFRLFGSLNEWNMNTQWLIRRAL